MALLRNRIRSLVDRALGKPVSLVNGSLRSMLKRTKFRLIEANFGWTAGVIAPLLRLTDPPLVVWLYGSDIFRQGPSRDKILPSLFHRPRTWFACLSDAIRRDIVHLGCPPERAHVFHPGVPVSPYIGKRGHRDEIRLLSVGRLVNFKAPLQLVDLASRLRDRRLAFHWEHIGLGPLEREMRAAIAARGLACQFRLAGEMENAKVLERMQVSDILVHEGVVAPDGSRESFGVVLIEAGAQGLPVVARSVGGISEIVRHGETGFLVELGDADGMADAVARLVVDSPRRNEMGAAARAHVSRCFNLEDQTRKIELFYDSIAEEST